MKSTTIKQIAMAVVVYALVLAKENANSAERTELITNTVTGAISSVRFNKLQKVNYQDNKFYLIWSVSGMLKSQTPRVNIPQIKITYLREYDLGGQKKLERRSSSVNVANPYAEGMIDAKDLPKTFVRDFKIGDVVTGSPQSFRVLAFRAMFLERRRVIDTFIKQDDAVLKQKGVPVDWWEPDKYGDDF